MQWTFPSLQKINRNTSLYQQGRTCGGKSWALRVGGDNPCPWRGPEWQRSSSKTWRISTRSGKCWGGECHSRRLNQVWTGAAPEFHFPSALTWVRVWFSSSLGGPEPRVKGARQQLACSGSGASGVWTGRLWKWQIRFESGTHSTRSLGPSWWRFTAWRVVVQRR